MNESDTDANTKAIDSLLNFETVKYFGAEQREAARYDKSMARYERLSVQDLRLARGAERRPGGHLHHRHDRRARDVRRRHPRHRNDIGDFVLLNAMMLQLYQPLNFMGMVYRDIKQAIVDIEMMFDILVADTPKFSDRAGRARRSSSRSGAVRFENVEFHYDPDAPILRGVSFEAPAGHTIAIVGPSGAGKSTISRLLFRFYEPSSGRITIDGQDIARRHAGSAARRDRHGAAGHRAVQRHDPLQHPLRPRRRERRGGRGGRARTRRSTPSSARCRRATARRSASAA